MFDQATIQKELKLNEVELSVEINAEGQISLVGNGGKLCNTGGITLKFVRPERKPYTLMSLSFKNHSRRQPSNSMK
ncbi:MAG: hypothetical protein AAFV72_13780 [Cyanobacteria bacterium J06635_1]